MTIFYTLFLGFLVGAIMRDVKERFGWETFWVGISIVTVLSVGAMVVYKDIL